MKQQQVYLASSSPRRAELLDQIAVRYSTVTVEVAESLLPGETAAQHVLRLALEKARAGWKKLGNSKRLPVLGADTVISLDGEIMGKPADREQGLDMLARLSGKNHQVLSGVALVHSSESTRLSVSTVSMREISQQEASDYWATGEPADKAGAYAIQGRAAMFVTNLNGSYSGVMGLPLYETSEVLSECGISLI